MDKIKTRVFLFIIAIATLGLISAGSVFADPRGDVPGYWTDSSGNIVRNSDGDCIHTSDWTPEMATVVGCDGVTLDKTAELFVGQPSGLVANINIPAASMFAFDSAELTEEGKEVIRLKREALANELSNAYAVIVIGHTDSTGNPDYNLDLSERRATSVRDYLISLGGNGDKLKAIGLGDMSPIASNDTDEGKAINRRVEVAIVAELRALDLLRFPSAVLFERRSADLTKEGEKSLLRDLEASLDLLQRATYIMVVGHTDDVGDDDYNLNLSEMRAEIVRMFLVELGVNPRRIDSVGAGESDPIADNNTPEGRTENRRVEILMLGRMR
jgi:OOP family OmpA-OmpF porin